MNANFPIQPLCDRLRELNLPLPDVELFAYLESGKVMVVIEQHGQRCLEIVDGQTTTVQDLKDRLNAHDNA